ncbi:3,4-dihydroxy-2-butanone-4-phosphate synthase [Levilactobacillus bambusae]|uniref:GTP cyclohydrolase-2 n=1 Tax=Levilactobacillus bambusae TaxID=2024736 RepID=A0A2V1MZD6_9LACO|nr:3,4-dihydroxy-2-butanone-4-phosphate synthase [Levilactobacillus bambusae]PWG00337.1 bifunctional 3,4-dihydroxy-2-butanone-4-phosphate synthase/GTP cyclohydrolase II [Levilactobacillus bambusae]
MKSTNIEAALTALRAGQLVLVVDDDHREAEGDLIGLSELATPETVNLMTQYGRGLICVPITADRAKLLHLESMTNQNTEHFGTAFTVSVDARTTTTGISAFERAATIRQLANPAAQPTDFNRPGHVFPLIAQPGGVLTRPGHTEAAVDLARLAGAKSTSAYICETLAPDGHMQRTDGLKRLADKLGMPRLTIAELAAYRYAHDQGVVTADRTVALPSRYGRFTLTDYTSVVDNRLQLLIESQTPIPTGAPLVRLHSECLTGDVFGSKRCDCGQQLQMALDRINQEGGYVLYLRQEGRGIGLKQKLRAYALQEQGYDTVEANEYLGFAPDERDYGLAAAILHERGLTHVRLLTNNPAKAEGLAQYGIVVDDLVPLEAEVFPEDRGYLKTKQQKFHHHLHLED